jgi:membrane peptidoglycan carboxypeptidase
MLEAEAFREIHKQWKKVGYAFDYLVPSLATSIGSSADKPAALAELMGILLNNGVRQPNINITSLHFAADTPYETILNEQAHSSERVLSPEVAATARKALTRIVEHGTARRVYKAFKDRAGNAVEVGGKTGTGDHRFETYGAGGVLKSSRVVNRTATFVFFIGERFFGTITAFVPGEDAAAFKFTSALPVQILKHLAPTISEHLVLQQSPDVGSTEKNPTLSENSDSKTKQEMDKAELESKRAGPERNREKNRAEPQINRAEPEINTAKPETKQSAFAFNQTPHTASMR